MKRWLRRIKYVYKYAKLYWRNTKREIQTVRTIWRLLSDDTPAKPRRSTRRYTQRHRTAIVRIPAFTRANGTYVKAHTRRVNKVVRNGRTTRR